MHAAAPHLPHPQSPVTHGQGTSSVAREGVFMAVHSGAAAKIGFAWYDSATQEVRSSCILHISTVYMSTNAETLCRCGAWRARMMGGVVEG